MSSTSHCSSAVGNAANAREPAWPSRDHSSSAACGASGASISTSASTASRGTGPDGYAFVRWLVSSVMRAIEVLKRSASMPSRTAAMARCSSRCVSSSSVSPSAALDVPVSSSTTTRQMRCSRRYMPTTALESHGRLWSSGPLNIS